MPPKAKAILFWIVLIAVLYTVVQNPELAANTVRSVWDFIYGTVSGFLKFLGSLAA